ncbi:MAG: transporter [Nitrospiraceae bacterium]
MGETRWFPLTFKLILLLLGSMSLAVRSDAEDNRWVTSLSMSHSNGNFGTSTPTSILSVPWTTRRLFEDGDISITIPYVSITGDCSVTLVNGFANKTGGTCKTGSVSLFGGRFVRTFTIPEVVTNNGLGDVVLQGRYYVMEENDAFRPLVAVTARVKFPTANPDVGLGTGKFDEGGGLEISKEVFPDWLVFLDGGFTVIGKPENVSLRNQWNYDAGFGYYFTDKLFGSVYYEEWRALLSGSKNPRDVLAGVNYKATPSVGINGSVSIGLSDGAPDSSLTGGISLLF